jgi:hypothetical protein
MDVRAPSAVLVVVKSVVRDVELVTVVKTVEVTVEGTWASTLRSDERNKTAIVDNRRTETNREPILNFMLINSSNPLPNETSTQVHLC